MSEMEASPDSEERRVVLALVLRFLHEGGYERSFASLSVESGVHLEQVEVAETVSLENVVTDYQTLYREKHGHAPQLAKESDFAPPLRLRPETIIGTTKLYGTTTPVSQEDFFRVLCANRSLDPESLFCIELPLSCARRFRPSQLTLTSAQEHVLYGLVGCADVGWRLSSVSQNSRAILEEKYSITKRMLQLFFKNRCQQKQRRKRKKSKEDDPQCSFLDDSSKQALLEGYDPIAPASSNNSLLPVNSLLEMVKGDEYESATDVHVPSALINPQTIERYTPSAHISEPTTSTQLGNT